MYRNWVLPLMGLSGILLGLSFGLQLGLTLAGRSPSTVILGLLMISGFFYLGSLVWMARRGSLAA